MMLKVFVSIPVGDIPHGTTLTDRKGNLAQEILDIPDDDKTAAHAREMQDRIADYL